jgi:hypothetical protein
MKTIGTILSFIIVIAMTVIYSNHKHDTEMKVAHLRVQIERTIAIVFFKGND